MLAHTLKTALKVFLRRKFFTGVNLFREQMRLNIRHELGIVRP